MITCHKDCKECQSLNIRTDDKGCPLGYKWMLPVKQSNITDHDWIHPKAKYHCFFKDTSLCEKYQQDQNYFETDIDYRRIEKEPELACKKCYQIWKMLN